jgi:catabolite regulation protein CreA
MSKNIQTIIIKDFNVHELNIDDEILKKSEIIIFNINNPEKYKQCLAVNKKYQENNKKIIYLIYSKEYNIIQKKFTRNSNDIVIVYNSKDDIDLYNYCIDTYKIDE